MRLTRFSCALAMRSLLPSRMDRTSDEGEWEDFRRQLRADGGREFRRCGLRDRGARLAAAVRTLPHRLANRLCLVLLRCTGGGRGRDAHYWAPPAQIPACAANAPGLYEDAAVKGVFRWCLAILIALGYGFRRAVKPRSRAAVRRRRRD